MLLFEALEKLDGIKESLQKDHPSMKETIEAFDIAAQAITAQIRLSEMLNSWWDDLKESDRLSAQAAYDIISTIRFDYEPAAEAEDPEEAPQTAGEIIRDTIDEICRNFCKYSETVDDNAECQWIREGNECPLDRLQ